MRFNGQYGVDYMIRGLAKEVNKRMSAVGVRGSKLVLKMMLSKDTTKVPGKFLGHGLCDNLSRSIDIQLTRHEDVISSAAIKLYKKLCVDDSSIRGMGIVINSLKFDDELNSSLDSSPSKLSAWLQPASTTNTTSKKMEELRDNSQNVAFAIEEENKVLSTETDSRMMPTFSQLDQDVLNNLPEDILLEVKSTYRKNSSHQSPTGVSPKLTSKTKRLSKDKAISITGQASVRRMLKLACVKSGNEQIGGNNDLSLSQLDSLPLELQLQIANEDNIEIAKRSKHKAKRAVLPHSNPAYYNEYTNSDVLSVRSREIEEQGRCSADSDQPTNFHHENIAPLRDFISSNPNPDREAVDAVQDFLTVCINERRIEDTVIFLRTIKKMNYGWDKAIYKQLRDFAVNQIMDKTGNVLDFKWLGL